MRARTLNVLAISLLGAASVHADPGKVGDADGPGKTCHIVFVSDGYTSGEKSVFLADARALASTLDTDPAAACMRQKKSFRYHFAFKPSKQDGCALAPGAPPRDTAFRSYVAPNGMALCDDKLVDRFAVAQAPDVDAVVVVMKFEGGGSPRWADADLKGFGSRVRIPRGWSNVFVHELGHALFGLGDEYGIHPEAIPKDEAAQIGLMPNLTTDPRGLRWRAITRSVIEGGATYERGVYHAEPHCRMNEQTSQSFCSVCRHAILFEPTRLPAKPRILAPTDGARIDAGSDVTVRWSKGGHKVVYYDFVFFRFDEARQSWKQAAYELLDETRSARDLGRLGAGRYLVMLAAANQQGASGWVSVAFAVGAPAAAPSAPSATSGVAGALSGH